MKIFFKEKSLEELYEEGKTKDKKYKKICKDKKLLEGYQKAVFTIISVNKLDELRQFSYLHFERLKYQNNDKKYSVRLVNSYIERLIFIERDNGIEVELIEIDSTHYGNK